FGVFKVYSADALENAIQEAFKEDSQLLIESALIGREVSVGVASLKGKTTVFPVTEIISENDFFDYAAKYEGQSQEITPADLPASWLDQVKNWSEMIYNRLELRGVVRSEFIFVEGVPHLLEINTVPGMTARSIIPQQVEAMGMNLKEFFTLLLKEALTENQHT
ncbi:MAG: D-alanine--D-alanine ligase family protein, partial [Flavobacteriaceae bacterium]